MKLADYDYNLPDVLIPQFPLQRRDASRLMVINRHTREIRHTQFSQIGEFLPDRARLVLNNTKVIPARLIGAKLPTGGKIELLLTRPIGEKIWEALIRPGRRVSRGTRLVFGKGELTAQIREKNEDGICVVRFTFDGDFQSILKSVGQIPLPPYIEREPDAGDRERYQCVYASTEGAIAAPTAGLHFTQALLDGLKRDGFDAAALTLHVGLGTFQPVKAENVADHKLHEEYYEIPKTTADLLNAEFEQARKVVAVGTTTVRALEAVASDGGIRPFRGFTDIFIYPGYQFKAVDALITNFHLPRSTLLMLVSAFADREFILEAYRQAIARKYRFYSYGDAMLIL